MTNAFSVLTAEPDALLEPVNLPSDAGEVDRSPFNPWVVILAASAILIHFLFNSGYGYFRDELYYAACGQRLAWGYVDHAPLVAFVLHFTRALLGDSLAALRLVPALSASAKVLLAGWMAREMGGGRLAQFLAALTTLIAPIYLTFDNLLSMNAFEPVLWMSCAAIVLRILNRGNQRLWLLFGFVAGVGLLNKHSMLFFGSGLTLGLLLSAPRQFANRWIWMGATIAAAIFLPNVQWEMHAGWPTIMLLHAVIGPKYVIVTPWDYIWQQTLLTLPLCAPIWLAGLYFLLADRAGRRYATLGIAYLVVLVEMLALHGKIYYLAPAYIMLLAGGSVWLEGQHWFVEKPWAVRATVAALAIGGIVAAPLAMPILPVQAAILYSRFWDVQDVHVENVPQDDLPQLFGDMYGWQEQVAAIAKIYNSLPAEDRTHAAVAGYNYGEAGAVDYFGKAYGLPLAISGHNQYGYWGPGKNPDVVVAIGYREEFLQRFFDDVELRVVINPQYALPEERNLRIYVCRNPKMTWDRAWPQWMYLN